MNKFENKHILDETLNNIESYYLSNKHIKDFKKNITNLNKKELEEIVSYL